MDVPDGRFLPPMLALDADDVIDVVEIVAEPDEDDDRNGDPDRVTEVVDAPGADEIPRVSGFDGVGTRREARERALALLYEAEQRGIEPLGAIIATLPVTPEAFATSLVLGVSDRQAEIDATIVRLSIRWAIDRMPAIDRALLRMGIYELTATDVPTGAAISEAVELAKRYSTDDSHTFVNGILARVATEARP